MTPEKPAYENETGEKAPSGNQRRSAMFFMSDKLTAADDAAFTLGEHGLTPQQITNLADHIVAAIDEWWSANVDD